MQRQAAKRLTTTITTQTHFLSVHFSSTCPYTPLSQPPPPQQQQNTDHQIFFHLLRACQLSLDLKTTAETHTRIIRFGYGTHPSLTSSLMTAYSHCGRTERALNLIPQLFNWTHNLFALNSVITELMALREFGLSKKVFDKMPQRDIVSWNALIGGYVRNALLNDALRVFRQMVEVNVEPDKFTFASVMTACSKSGGLGIARWLHGLMIERGIEFDSNPILGAALIDMYAKCGRIGMARDVFDRVRRVDVSVWNAMIGGLAVHGLAADAISVFNRMGEQNVPPDGITFLGILTACSHCGLVGEGRKYFELMRMHTSIQPQVDHYGAMVDMLGRAGFVEEAYSLIKSMPMEPDAVIWRALLSACRIHKKAELAELAMKHIMRLGSGDFVLLSNIYCSEDRWDSAERVREMMKQSGVRKFKGRSWFEFAGQLRHFKAGDRSHPETAAVYKVLEGLIQRTKLEGFVPTTDLVLMDISEEEKETNLFQHSEKLALAYGILKTSPGTEIVISKNLRICYDCHNWIKLVSKLLSRVIIIRDRLRFHRFEGGQCSCRDYW